MTSRTPSPAKCSTCEVPQEQDATGQLLVVKVASQAPEVTKFMSCVQVQVPALGSPSLIVRTVSVDVGNTELEPEMAQSSGDV